MKVELRISKSGTPIYSGTHDISDSDTGLADKSGSSGPDRRRWPRHSRTRRIVRRTP